MRKNFLVLMLMVLLPLAGWAQTDISLATNCSAGEYIYGYNSSKMGCFVTKDVALELGTHFEIESDATGVIFYEDEALTQPTGKSGLAGRAKLEVGTYYVKVLGKSPNFKGEKAANVEILKAPLAVTMTLAPESATLTKEYDGTTNVIPGVVWSYSGTGYKNDDDASALILDAGGLKWAYTNANVSGDHDITFTGLSAKNYDVTCSTAEELTITPKGLTAGMVTPVTLSATYKKSAFVVSDLAVDVKDGGKTLSAANSDFEIEAYGSYTADPETWGSKVASPANAGTYYIKVTSGASTNYTGSAYAGTFTINKKDLYVYPYSDSSEYNGEEQILSKLSHVEYNGLVSGDLKDDTNITLKEVTGTKAQEYGLTVKVTSPNSLESNYKIKTTGGTWTITKKYLSITPKALEHEYGQPMAVAETDDLILEGNLADDADAIKGYCTVSIAGVDANSAPKLYVGAITVNLKTTTAANNFFNNYEVHTFPADYTVTATSYTVIAKNITATYGDAPAYAFIDAAGKTVTNVKYTIKKDGEIVEPKNVGDYDIVIDPTSIKLPANYVGITTVDGALKIEEKKIKITPKNQTLVATSTEAALETYNINNSMVNIEPALVAGDKIQYTLKFNTSENSGMVDSNSELVAGDGEDTNWVEATKTWNKAIIVQLPVAADAGFANGNYDITVETSDAATATITISDSEVLTLDANDESLAEIIKVADGKTVDVKFASPRTLLAGQWNTLVLPFATSVEEVSAALGYAVVDMLDVNNADPSKISLKLAFGDIPANTAFLVQPKADTDLSDVSFDAVVISKENIGEDGLATGAKDASNHSFIGSYIKAGYQVTSDNENEYFYSTSEKKFTNSEGTTRIHVFGAFLRDASNGARLAVIDIQEPDGSTTSIKTVNSAERNVEGWYNLNGVKIEGAPTQKGIYINNGKKVVIK